eukprot:jgi/Ulvmu1/9808/UM056_0048.1
MSVSQLRADVAQASQLCRRTCMIDLVYITIYFVACVQAEGMLSTTAIPVSLETLIHTHGYALPHIHPTSGFCVTLLTSHPGSCSTGKSGRGDAETSSGNYITSQYN